MLADAHCHPFDLASHFPSAENERRNMGVICASSATTLEEFEYCGQLAAEAKNAGAAPILPCFAVHPQYVINRAGDAGLGALHMLASQGRLSAVGETGFDLYNAEFRAAEKIQEQLFEDHLAVALKYDLPVVVHARRAMHKIFAYAPYLKKCRAVIFHSWPGTAGEGGALLRRGINAFFSFGAIIMLNHREAMRCCSVFPANRLLTETDAPFQPPRGRAFSRYADLPDILAAMAALRAAQRAALRSDAACSEAGNLEKIIEENFRLGYSVPRFATE